MWKLTKLVIIDGAASASVIHDLSKMTHIHTRTDTYSDQNQNPKVLKIVTNSYGSIVLSSKVRAHKSLVGDTKPSHDVGGLSRTYEISLYRLTRPRMVLNVSVCRVSIVVYIHKILALKTLFLKSDGTYSAWVLHWSFSFFSWWYLYCGLNISGKKTF